MNYRKESFGFSFSNPRHKSQPQEQWVQHSFHNFLVSGITLSSKRSFIPQSTEPFLVVLNQFRRISQTWGICCPSALQHFPNQSQRHSLFYRCHAVSAVCQWKWKSLQEGRTVQVPVMHIWAHRVFDWVPDFCTRYNWIILCKAAATGVKDHLTLFWEQNLNKTYRSMVFLYPHENPLPMLPRMPWLLSGSNGKIWSILSPHSPCSRTGPESPWCSQWCLLQCLSDTEWPNLLWLLRTERN